jgi:hypothetical protein
MKREQRHKDRLLQLSKNERITLYSPKLELVEAAQERIIGMVEYFRLAVRDADWKKEWDYLERLARSCYLQGAQDTANVAAQMRLNEAAK